MSFPFFKGRWPLFAFFGLLLLAAVLKLRAPSGEARTSAVPAASSADVGAPLAGTSSAPEAKSEPAMAAMPPQSSAQRPAGAASARAGVPDPASAPQPGAVAAAQADPLAPPPPAASARSGSAASLSAAANADASAAAFTIWPAPVDVATVLEGFDLAVPGEQERVAALLAAMEDKRMGEVRARAALLGVPLRGKTEDGAGAEIFAFRGDTPLYRRTLNRNAGISTGADLLRAAPYGFNGTNLLCGVWDEAWVRGAHQEFGTRVTTADAAGEFNDHATHVAGTMAASGVDSAAIGMAPRLRVSTYDWNNDFSEMTAAGAATNTNAAKIPVSNHSYGIVTFDIDDQGRYEALARGADGVARALPFYLQFWAAGNSQGDFPDFDGYHTISFVQLAKNIVTVGAVDDAVNAGVRSTNNATMSDFSSWGPCDDGRIKPDVVANGVGVYSPVAFDSNGNSSTNAYDGTYSGTSMASPNAAGTAALLVQCYRANFTNTFPSAALLKNLLIHTADDLGTAGPDYKFGWGLIDGKEAADLIIAHKTDATRPKFFEGSVSSANRLQSFTMEWDGVSPIRATLVWMDPPGAAQTAADSRVSNLVHNLDLQVTGPVGSPTVYRPFVMPFVGTWTKASMSSPATTGKNNTDNVEQVFIPAPPAPGNYTINVSVDGPVAGTQRFALIATGFGAPRNPPPVVSLLKPANGAVFGPGTPVDLAATATDLNLDRTPGTVTSLRFYANGAAITPPLTAAPYEATWTPPGIGTYDVTARAVDAEGAEGVSSLAQINVRYSLPGEVAPDFVPPLADDHVQALAADETGRIYIGGKFKFLSNGRSPASSLEASRLARLAADGTIDASFAAVAGVNGPVRALQYDRPQKALYVAGDFDVARSVLRTAVVRLKIGQDGVPDGTVDTAFDAGIARHPGAANPPYVGTVHVQDDGKIILGGSFDLVRGTPRANLVRLNADGTVDDTFVAEANGAVHSVAVQVDGKILIGGEFTQLNNSVFRSRIARLNPDGTIDDTFETGSGVYSGFNGPVHSVAVNLAGEIYVGGSFSRYRFHNFYNNLAKLRPDGSIDGEFNFSPGLTGAVEDIHLRSSGEILVAGSFTDVGNERLPLAPTPAGRVTQLRPDGTLDTLFNPSGPPGSLPPPAGADDVVHDSILLANGDVLLAGGFRTFNGIARHRLVVVSSYDRISPPVLTSRTFRVVNAGEPLDHYFQASGQGPHSFMRTGDPLPRGVRFDPATGRLHGVPLEAGTFRYKVSATSPGGTGAGGDFVLTINPADVSFAEWQRAWFDDPSSPAAAPDAVNNGVGLSNLEIYALTGGDPRAFPSDYPLLVPYRDGYTACLAVRRFPLANYAGATNVKFEVVQTGLALGPWQEGQVSTLEESSDQIFYKSEIPLSVERNQFFRLRLIVP